MTFIDDDSQKPPHSDVPTDSSGAPAQAEPPGQISKEVVSFAGMQPGAPTLPDSRVPEDLRISWSWIHLLVFVVFFIATQITIVELVMGYYSVYRHLSQKQLKALLESDPKLLAGSSILTFALILLFLYVTLALLREAPFWRTLGWKKLQSDPAMGKGRPWMYFLSGCGLSLFVAIAGSQVKDAEHAPIQEFFKSRSGAMLLMAMAVLVAPVAEETIFRGYLYPVLARTISAATRFFGLEFSLSIRAGVASSILVTGTLFGLAHGPQLGGSPGLVILLILVGVIFTFARAWTGTVVASFLLHLGYNSTIAITSIIATKGFTQMPPHP